MKLNNKGFTLIEVIIAMAIMTSIIFIGYQVINKTDNLRRDQMIVSNIQNGANNLKRYITKDVKESKSVYIKYVKENLDLKESEKVNNLYKVIQSEINNKDYIEYKYIINTKGKEVNYIVQVIKDENKNKKLYSIYREEEKVSFSLIEKQPLSDNMIPLKITEKDGLYDVQLNYIKDNTKVYSFDVYNSLLAYNDEDINKPTDPQVPDTGDHSKAKEYFSYCINNSIKNLSNLNIEDSNFKKGLSQLEELLNLDIRKDDLEDKIEYSYNTISTFYDDYYWKLDKSDYESINKALEYIYVASEIEDNINDSDNDDNVVNIIENIKHGLYGDDNEKFADCYIKLTNEIYSYLFYEGNVYEIAKAQKISNDLKYNLNSFRNCITNKASKIYVDIHGVNPNIDKVKEVCDEANNMIDNTINSIVYIKSTVRWDLTIKGNYVDVVKAQMDVVKIEEDLIDKLVEVKSLVYDDNYYNGEI